MKVCLKAAAVTQQDSYFTVQTDSVPIRIWFLTDQILRIRAGFDGDFAEESYSLVTTAWEDRMDGFMKDYRKRITPAQSSLTDGEDKAVIQGKRAESGCRKRSFPYLRLRQGRYTDSRRYRRSGLYGRQQSPQDPYQ